MTFANQYREFVIPLLVKAFTNVNGRNNSTSTTSRPSLTGRGRTSTFGPPRHCTERSRLLRDWAVRPSIERQY